MKIQKETAAAARKSLFWYCVCFFFLVNSFSLFFRIFYIFMIYNQNICFFFFYVNQVIHILSMWTMWIILCITLFFKVFYIFKKWKTFAPIFIQSTFLDKLCAMCQKYIFFRQFIPCHRTFPLPIG